MNGPTHRIGFVQFSPILGALDLNIERLMDLVKNQAEPADLLVLPEMALTGYAFRNREELGRITTPENTEKTLATAVRLSRSFGDAAVVLGYPEWTEEGGAEDRGRFFNSAMLVGPDGLIGNYQKTHLFGYEEDLFLPGRTGFEVFRVRDFTVGIMICFDWFFPESARTLALRGAEIIAHPTNLVMPYCQRAMFTRALENSVYTITANRCGMEMHQKELRFTGESVIYGPRGNILASAPKAEDHVAVIEIDINRARNKHLNSHNHIFDDRVPELYEL